MLFPDWRLYGGTRTSRLLHRLSWCGRSSYPPFFMPMRAGPWQQKSREGSNPLRWDAIRNFWTFPAKTMWRTKEVRNKIQNATGVHDNLLIMVRKWKPKWYGHISRPSGMAKKILQDTLKGARRRGRQNKSWDENFKKWTGLEIPWGQRTTGKARKVLLQRHLWCPDDRQG